MSNGAIFNKIHCASRQYLTYRYLFFLHFNFINNFIKQQCLIKNSTVGSLYLYSKILCNFSHNIDGVITTQHTLAEAPLIISNKQKVKRYPFNQVTLYTILADVEHLMGTPIIFQIQHLYIKESNLSAYILKLFFVSKFTWIDDSLGISAKVSFLTYYWGLHALDLDLIVDHIKLSFDTTHYAMSTKLFKIFSDMFCLIWPYTLVHFEGVGILFRMSGKFSRHLLTQARPLTTRLGHVGFGTVKHNITYRYRQAWSESGAYGVNLYYFTKNKVKLRL